MASVRRLGDGGGAGGAVLLAVSLVGLAVALVVAGRIVFVVGVSRRREGGSRRG